MRNDRTIDVSFSAIAEDYIRRFMKVAEETMPNERLIPVIDWYISGKFTNKVTGEVRTFEPGVDVGAMSGVRRMIGVVCGEKNAALHP